MNYFFKDLQTRKFHVLTFQNNVVGGVFNLLLCRLTLLIIQRGGRSLTQHLLPLFLPLAVFHFAVDPCYSVCAASSVAVNTLTPSK